RKFVNPGWFIAAPICAVGTYLIATFAVEGLVYLFHIDRIKYLDTYAKAGYGMWFGVLLVAVQPGIIEELAFRGVILTSLQRVLGNTEALVVSALMFAILHLSIPSIPHLFLMGVVLGWFRLRSGSILPGMLLHFTHNLLVVLAEQHGSIFPW
ncbi:MAG: CPBP family intramembrane metalloprotease, partial [Anaerolineae bacterium]|nr:CPBP family intramembrane metalloprotease [Phycisphaerae bacterium]